MNDTPNTYRAGPDEDGHFGIYGGRYVAETLMSLLREVEAAYDEAWEAEAAVQAASIRANLPSPFRQQIR